MSGVRHPGAPAGAEVLESRRRVAAYLRCASGSYLDAVAIPGHVLVYAVGHDSYVVAYALPTRKVRSAMRVLENEVGSDYEKRLTRLLELAPPVENTKLARQLACTGSRLATIDSSGQPTSILPEELFTQLYAESMGLAFAAAALDES